MTVLTPWPVHGPLDRMNVSPNLTPLRYQILVVREVLIESCSVSTHDHMLQKAGVQDGAECAEEYGYL